MKLEFVIKRAYGRERYYPVNAVAGALVNLTKRVCLTDVEVMRLKFVGFEVTTTEETDMPKEELNGHE